MTRSALSVATLILCGVWAVCLGLYFMFLRPGLLPEDARYIGESVSRIQSVAPGLIRWLHRVFVVMGGFMAAMGVLTIFVSATAARRRGGAWVLALAGLFSVINMSFINFVIGSDYRWLLLVPALLWVSAVGSLFFK